MGRTLENKERVPYFAYGAPTRRFAVTAGLALVIVVIGLIAAIAVGRAILDRSADPVDGRYVGWYSWVHDDDGEVIESFLIRNLVVDNGSLTAAEVWVTLGDVRFQEIITFDPPLQVENSRFEFHGRATVEGRFYGDGRQVKGTWQAGSFTDSWEARWTEDPAG